MKSTLGTAIAAAIILALLSSCVGIDADARIGADGAVDLSLVYTVSKSVDELGKLGSNASYLPLPIGRDELELAATRAGGSLGSWSRSDGPDAISVKAAFRFPNPAAFALFMDPSGELAAYAEAGGRKTLTLTLSRGLEPADPELAEFVRVAFESYRIAIRFRLPKAPTASSGLSASGQTLSFSRPAAELYSAAEPVVVSFSW